MVEVLFSSSTEKHPLGAIRVIRPLGFEAGPWKIRARDPHVSWLCGFKAPDGKLETIWAGRLASLPIVINVLGLPDM